MTRLHLLMSQSRDRLGGPAQRSRLSVCPVTATAANFNEFAAGFHGLTTMPPVGGQLGPNGGHPDRLSGDRNFDSEPLRALLRWLGITPVIAKRNTEHGSGLGEIRWAVERTNSWLHFFGRLRRRLDRFVDIQEGFLRLDSSIPCVRCLT